MANKSYYENLKEASKKRTVVVSAHLVNVKLGSRFLSASSYMDFLENGVFIYTKTKAPEGLVFDPHPSFMDAERCLCNTIRAISSENGNKEKRVIHAAHRFFKYVTDLSRGGLSLSLNLCEILLEACPTIFHNMPDDRFSFAELVDGRIHVIRAYASIHSFNSWEDARDDYNQFRETDARSLECLTFRTPGDIQAMMGHSEGTTAINRKYVEGVFHNVGKMWEDATIYVADDRYSLEAAPQIVSAIRGRSLQNFRETFTRLGSIAGFKHMVITYSPGEFLREWTPSISYFRSKSRGDFVTTNPQPLTKTVSDFFDLADFNLSERYLAFLAGE